jgi:hypothetical protein
MPYVPHPQSNLVGIDAIDALKGRQLTRDARILPGEKQAARCAAR